LRDQLNIRFWHKADMLNGLTNVRFWGQKRTVTNRCLPNSIYEYTAFDGSAEFGTLERLAMRRLGKAKPLVCRAFFQAFPN
jgi:hypothetical protein